MTAPSSPGNPFADSGFATTRWSVVLRARGSDAAEARSALAALCERSSERRAFHRWCDQLEVSPADIEEGDRCVLGGDLFDTIAAKAQLLFEVLGRLADVADRDRQVIELHLHGCACSRTHTVMQRIRDAKKGARSGC